MKVLALIILVSLYLVMDYYDCKEGRTNKIEVMN